MSAEKTAMGDDVQRTPTSTSQPDTAVDVQPKKPWWNSVRVAGSATQIVIAAALAIAIGLAVSTTVDEVPKAAITLVAIPGNLWLRSLKAVGMWLYLALARTVSVDREYSSPAVDCHSHDPGRSAPSGHVRRWYVLPPFSHCIRSSGQV